MMNEAAIPSGTPDVSGAVVASGSIPAGSSPAPTTTDFNSSDNVTTNPVQGNATQQTAPETDPLAGIPSLDDVQSMETVSKEAFLRLRGEYDKVAPQFKDVSARMGQYEPVLSRFEQPEALQEVIALHDNLIGWERDTASGQLVPATLAGAQAIAEKYPQHADFLAADLLNMQTRDAETGQLMTRMDIALKGIAGDPQRRAAALKLLGAVEPTSISPQWQATAEELANVREDLQDVYRALPYEDRQELKLNNPDFINRYLTQEKLTQDLQAERQQAQQATQQQAAQRETYLAHQASTAGESHLQTQLGDALTKFHQSVVGECNFIAPLDPQAPPDGMDAAAVATMNQQIAASNKAEAAQITLAVVGLINPQTRQYVLPLLREIGAVDDKLLADMEAAATGLGNNARNYGELAFRGKLAANGNGFQPDASMTGLSNEATRSLNRLVHFANQVKSRLMERRSQFFSMKALDHNTTLNGAVPARQVAQGGNFDPGTAPRAQPTGWMPRGEIERQYGS